VQACCKRGTHILLLFRLILLYLFSFTLIVISEDAEGPAQSCTRCSSMLANLLLALLLLL
jgi:hypothetical protein